MVSASMHGLASAKDGAVVSANLNVCDPVDHDPNTIGEVLRLELA
jgi:hypothetical protein